MSIFGFQIIIGSVINGYYFCNCIVKHQKLNYHCHFLTEEQTQKVDYKKQRKRVCDREKK